MSVPVQVTDLKPAEHSESEGSQDQDVKKSEPEIKNEDVLSQKEAEHVKEEVKNKEEEHIIISIM